MADGSISQIQFPDESVYEIKDTTARGMNLVATYTAATFDLALNISLSENDDDEEF